MSVKIVYEDIAVGAAEDASVSATLIDADADIDLLPFGSDKGKYATLERNYWVLDGSIDIYDGQEIGYLSTVLSDDNCDLASPYPTITIYFDEHYTSLGIYIEQVEDGYCNSLTITWYDGSTVLDTKDFTPSSAAYFCENTVTNYNKVVIACKKMTLPNRRVRISFIAFGLTRIFEQSELRSGSAKVIQQIDNTGRELAVNTLDFTLSSKTPVEYIFQTRQPMAAYDGNALIGVFYVRDSDRLAARQHKIACDDAIGVLGDDPFPDAVYTNKNAYALAQEICGDFEVDMSASLQSATVTGILYQQTRRSALQQLCFAINAVADTSGTEKIKIFPLPNDNPVVLDENRLRPSGTVTKQTPVTSVTVTAHSYSTSGSGQGIVINGTTYYDTPTTQTIVNPEVSANEKANAIEVSDCTLISSANLASVTQHLFDEVTKHRKHNVSFRINGDLVGEYVQTLTPWQDNFTGHYIRGTITLSSFGLTQAEVIGENERSV